MEIFGGLEKEFELEGPTDPQLCLILPLLASSNAVSLLPAKVMASDNVLGWNFCTSLQFLP